MADHPEATFTHSQVSSYATIRRTDPGIFRKVQRLIREGRWENAAGTWVEGDLNMADGEAVVRHMLYAADWSKRHLGGQARVLWEPDTFGHPGNMPQLARLGEFDSYFHMRCNPGGQDNWAARLWTGVDGTTIPAFSQHYNGSLLPDDIRSRTLPQFAAGAQDALLIWGIGDHGGALARYTLGLLETYRHKPLVPTLRFNTLSGVLRAFQDRRFRWRRNRGETFSLFEGCFTTHASIKRCNRACEGALLSAESLAVLAGLDRVATLREAWIPTLFNQFHDLLDGAAVHDSYRDAHRRAGRSLRAAARVTRQALHALAGPTSGRGRILTVVNPLGFERTEPIRLRLPPTTRCLLDETGAVIPVQRLEDQFVFVAQKVPAFSSKSYRIADRLPRGWAAPAVAVTETHAPANEPTNTFRIETRRAVVHVARDSGIIGSFHDKALNREFIPYGVPRYLSHTTVTRKDLAMNVFQVVDESANRMSAWLIHDIRREENLVAGARVTLLEAGPVFARLRVQHRFRASSLEEDILFYQDHPRVDFELRLNWREKGSENAGVPQLKVGFNASVRAPRFRAEGPFTVVERPADGQEQPTQKWADLSGDEGGVTLYNDSRYGCDALGTRLRLTLLRNPYGPDLDPDSGRHVVRFALESHGPGLPNADLVRAGLAFNRPLLGVVTARPARRARPPVFEILGAPAVVVTALRRAEHSSGILLRLFETGGKPCRAVIRAGLRLRSAREVNFQENPVGPSLPARRNRVSCVFRPFEVKTLQLEADW
jgi:alpha-mannosidase